MSKSWQGNSDGTLVLDEAPAHPSVEDRERILKQALSDDGWTATLTQKPVPGARFVKFESELSKGDVQYELHIFVFPNLNWANRGLYEKRIEISRPYEEHETEFLLSNEDRERCLLLGFYIRDGCEIICAWDPRVYREHANPHSCYVSVNAIAQAMRDGFAQSIDKKGRLVCCFKNSFFHFYINNMNELHDRVVVSDLRDKIADKPGVYDSHDLEELEANNINPTVPRNRIVYGAPGTGKSHLLNEEIRSLFPDHRLQNRVTFYPDFTHSDFFGAYMPTPIYRESNEAYLDSNKTTLLSNHEPIIDYKFSPGPFMEILSRAIRFPELNFVLIIEELNRADAPAVFGDVFQLLDRNDQTGDSKFPISIPRPARDFLASLGISDSSLMLPGNLYIWCTLNSADQGVMPLDAAFKRRWSFEYLPLNQNESVADDWKIYLHFLGKEIGWNVFRTILNQALSRAGVQEDRLIGPFFMSQEELSSQSAFKNKLLVYLREDVLRHEPELIFRQVNSFGELIEAYDRGDQIFNDSLDFSDH